MCSLKAFVIKNSSACVYKSMVVPVIIIRPNLLICIMRFDCAAENDSTNKASFIFFISLKFSTQLLSIFPWKSGFKISPSIQQMIKIRGVTVSSLIHVFCRLRGGSIFCFWVLYFVPMSGQEALDTIPQRDRCLEEIESSRRSQVYFFIFLFIYFPIQDVNRTKNLELTFTIYINK